MQRLNLKPTHKLVAEYYRALTQFRSLRVSHETAVRAALQNLLESCARQFGWALVLEWPIKREGRRSLRVDGALLDQFRLRRGAWEAKDEADDPERDPVRLDDFNASQPDVALLRPRDDFYAASHPRPDDVLLVVEVADTSASYDRLKKVPLYAGAGVAEVWLVDLTADAVEIYARPEGETYRETARRARGERVGSSNLAGLNVTVEEILG